MNEVKDLTGSVSFFLWLHCHSYSILICEKAFKFRNLCVSCVFYVFSFCVINSQKHVPINWIDPEIPLFIMVFHSTFFKFPPKWKFMQSCQLSLRSGQQRVRWMDVKEELAKNHFTISWEQSQLNTYLNYVSHAPFVGCTY